ncbi:MAG: site-specific DNA-methyltransferase [Chloroflexi bacterium]|nr:site-specific DNA-methyltransferase [Chloroflexota bacterium]
MSTRQNGAQNDGAARLIVGNCVDVMRNWADGIIKLTVTSPPYDGLRDYKGYDFPFEEIANELFRVTAEGGVVVWVVGDRINGGRSLTSFRQALTFQRIGFTAHDVMIYQKKNTPFTRSNAYTNAYEMMFVLSKGKPATFNPLKAPTQRHGYEMLTHNKLPDGINKKKLGKLNKEKTRTNIWSYAVGLGGTTNDKIAFQHPAVFPEKLALDHILSWSNPGDLVLDPMCGSGTTGKMALLQGRAFIGIDISPEYIAIARQRLEASGIPVAIEQNLVPPG